MHNFKSFRRDCFSSSVAEAFFFFFPCVCVFCCCCLKYYVTLPDKATSTKASLSSFPQKLSWCVPKDYETNKGSSLLHKQVPRGNVTLLSSEREQRTLICLIIAQRGIKIRGWQFAHTPSEVDLPAETFLKQWNKCTDLSDSCTTKMSLKDFIEIVLKCLVCCWKVWKVTDCHMSTQPPFLWGEMKLF